MIKIFRKIRQNLLSEGKTGKYFKYAIGEIVLVVIGILIALQINNWNQNRLNEQLESQYYERLLEDIREEKIILQAVMNYSNQVLGHAKSAIKVFEVSPDANQNPLDNIIDMYQASQLQDPYSASSTYKELIASGQINLIQNDSLKTALIRYYEIDWTNGGLFNLENTYRDNLRRKMPNDIQSEVRLTCGDVYLKHRNAYQTSLPENCKIDIDHNIAKSVVANLRKDESLKEDLRYLIGNESGKLNDLESIQEQLNNLISQLEAINNDEILLTY